MTRTMTALCCAALLTVLPVSASAKGPLPEPDDGPDPRGLTVFGSGIARVAAPSRSSEGPIRRAIEAARPAAYARAVAHARARAADLAARTGLTLGAVQAITSRDQTAELGYGQSEPCFGRRCRAPATVTASVAITFATAQTSAAASTGTALVATALGYAPVRPRRPRSEASIAAAVLRGRLAAGPVAFAAARRSAELAATAAGRAPGQLVAIAEVRRPFEDFNVGAFGSGRYCGYVQRRIVRRDPATGRRRVVRRVRQRRCFAPDRVAVALRVTYLPG